MQNNENVFDVPGGSGGQLLKPPTAAFTEMVHANLPPADAEKKLDEITSRPLGGGIRQGRKNPLKVQSPMTFSSSKLAAFASDRCGIPEIPHQSTTLEGRVNLLRKLAGDHESSSKKAFIRPLAQGFTKVFPRAGARAAKGWSGAKDYVKQSPIGPAAIGAKNLYGRNMSGTDAFKGMLYGGGADAAFEGFTGGESYGTGMLGGAALGLFAPKLRRLTRNMPGRDYAKKVWRGASDGDGNPNPVGGLRTNLARAETIGMLGYGQEMLTPEGYNFARPIQTARNMADRQAQTLGFEDRRVMNAVLDRLRSDPRSREAFLHNLVRRLS